MLDKNGNFVPNKRREGKINLALDRLGIDRNSRLSDFLRPTMRAADVKGYFKDHERYCAENIKRLKDDIRMR